MENEFRELNIRTALFADEWCPVWKMVYHRIRWPRGNLLWHFFVAVSRAHNRLLFLQIDWSYVEGIESLHALPSGEQLSKSVYQVRALGITGFFQINSFICGQTFRPLKILTQSLNNGWSDIRLEPHYSSSLNPEPENTSVLSYKLKPGRSWLSFFWDIVLFELSLNKRFE